MQTSVTELKSAKVGRQDMTEGPAAAVNVSTDKE